MSKEQAAALCEDLENWMTKLPPKLKTVPINLLSIPGSHDSMTSAISSHSKVSPDAEKFLQRLKFLGPLLRLVMSRWSKTQDLDLTQQLVSGIRYFDLRVAPKKSADFPFFVHGLYAEEVPSKLKELQVFLSSHPGEVVFLDFQHFYGFNDNEHRDLIAMLKSTLGNSMTPYTSHMDNLTLDNMVGRFGYQVIVIYRAYFDRFKEFNLWPSFSIPTPWPQTVNEEELFKKLDEGVESRSYTSGYVSQCVLTPTSWFVTKNIFSTLKKRCAEPVHKGIIEWLEQQKMGVGGLNIVISDFININDNQFAKQVVGLNAKYLHNSLLGASSLTPVDEN